MKKYIKYFVIPIFAVAIYIGFSSSNVLADKAGCEAYLYISNNSLFEVNLTIDGFPSGNLMTGRSKTYTVTLVGDAGKRIKVKAEYQDPDYIDPKAINYVTKQKLECGVTDTVYVAFTK